MIYGTIQGADEYHEARGNTGWDGANDEKQVALLRGSEYIDQNFRASFPGWKVGQRTQIREWPRSWAFDNEGNTIGPDVVPIEAEHAAYEAALRELVEPGALSPDYNPGSQTRREKVDVIEVEYTAPHGPGSVRPIISIIGGILAPILTGGVQSSVAGRAVRI